MKFSKRLDRFGEEIFGELNKKRLELEAQNKKLYNLSIGTPDFVVSEEIRASLCEAAQDPDNWKYALRDLPELLETVAEYYKKRFGVTITTDMIASCYGTQEGMGHLALALCDEGDTVLLPTPCYPVFIASAKLAGAEVYYYKMTEETAFLPDVTTIPDEVADRAKYMVVSLPSNPTGSIGNDRVYKELIAFAEKHDILLIHDNAYSDIIFDGVTGGSFLAYEGAAQVGAEFFSLSKSFDITGARVSFLIGRPDVIQAFSKLRSQIDFGMFLPIQRAAITALKSDLARVREQCDEYEARRNALCESFGEIGWEIPKNAGSMFVWAKIPEGFESSMQFCTELMEKAGVICTPGESFGPEGREYVRFALVLPPEKLREAAQAIRESGLFAGK